MGKTNGERCKKHREDNKDEYRKSDRERKQLSRKIEKILDPKKYELKKKNERERLRLYRLKKKIERNTPVTPSDFTPTPESSFTTKQSLSRSLKKAKQALPTSPNKQKQVVTCLAKQFRLKIEYDETRGRKPNILNAEKLIWLENFFDRPDITYINPGRKDNVYIGKENSERKYEQKKYPDDRPSNGFLE